MLSVARHDLVCTNMLDAVGHKFEVGAIERRVEGV